MIKGKISVVLWAFHWSPMMLINLKRFQQACQNVDREQETWPLQFIRLSARHFVIFVVQFSARFLIIMPAYSRSTCYDCLHRTSHVNCIPSASQLWIFWWKHVFHYFDILKKRCCLWCNHMSDIHTVSRFQKWISQHDLNTYLICLIYKHGCFNE